MSTIIDKYITIFKITKEIIIHPFAFAETLEDTFAETKRGARYLAEGVVFSLATFQLVTGGNDPDLALLDLPFAGEIVGAIMIVAVMLTGLLTHPFARVFSTQQASLNSSFAPFLYWTGFCLFVVPPFAAILIFGAKAVFGLISLSALMQILLLAVFVLPVIFIYYLGTITSWIGHNYKIGPFMGGLAIIFGYTLSMALSGGALAVYYGLSDLVN